MGSFYSTCSISNMTLAHQKTSIQLLAPSAYKTDFSDDLGMIVCNEGSQAFFSPFGFPIHGEYDDYGYIHSITRNKCVTLLEDYFGVDIELILNNIGDERDIPNDIKHVDVYKKLAKTYFRTEVLEFLERGCGDYDLENPQQYSSSSRLKKILEAIEKKASPQTKARLKELKEKCNNKNISTEEISEYWKLSEEDKFKSYDYERTYINSSSINMFNELDITSQFKDEIIKQFHFLQVYGWDLQRILLPSNYGTQQTNWCKLYKLNDFVNDLLYSDIKETYEKWGDEDEYYNDEREIISLHQVNKRDKTINKILDA